MLPTPSTAMPKGLTKKAPLPVPFTVVPLPKGEPAIVETTPAGVILRIEALPESAT